MTEHKRLSDLDHHEALDGDEFVLGIKDGKNVRIRTASIADLAPKARVLPLIVSSLGGGLVVEIVHLLHLIPRLFPAN